MSFDLCDAELRHRRAGARSRIGVRVGQQRHVVPERQLAQEVVDEVHVSEDASRLCVRIVRQTRTTDGIELGASPRASRHLLTAAKARAAAQGRNSVEIEDVTWLAPFVLSHRVSAEDTVPREIVARAVERAVG